MHSGLLSLHFEPLSLKFDPLLHSGPLSLPTRFSPLFICFLLEAIEQADLAHLVVGKLLERVRALVVLGVRAVVGAAVGEDALQVGGEDTAVMVVVVLQAVGHRLQIWTEKRN